jgi:hypothetical protein
MFRTKFSVKFCKFSKFYFRKIFYTAHLNFFSKFRENSAEFWRNFAYEKYNHFTIKIMNKIFQNIVYGKILLQFFLKNLKISIFCTDLLCVDVGNYKEKKLT